MALKYIRPLYVLLCFYNITRPVVESILTALKFNEVVPCQWLLVFRTLEKILVDHVKMGISGKFKKSAQSKRNLRHINVSFSFMQLLSKFLHNQQTLCEQETNRSCLHGFYSNK